MYCYWVLSNLQNAAKFMVLLHMFRCNRQFWISNTSMLFYFVLFVMAFVLISLNFIMCSVKVFWCEDVFAHVTHVWAVVLGKICFVCLKVFIRDMFWSNNITEFCDLSSCMRVFRIIRFTTWAWFQIENQYVTAFVI